MTNIKSIVTGMFSVALLATACNGEEDTIPPTRGEVSTEDAVEYLNITYQGETYLNVPTTYDENGDFIFHDEVFSSVYEKELLNDSDWSISISGSNDIEFFPSLDSNLKAQGLKVDLSGKFTEAVFAMAKTRAGYDDLASVTLYDDKNFKDRHYPFALNDSVTSIEVAKLGGSPYNFNDKCSSIRMVNNLPDDPSQTLKLGYFSYPCTQIDAVFIGYDDSGFSDRTITCVAPTASQKEWASLPGFNDKLSSFKFFFAQKGQYETKF